VDNRNFDNLTNLVKNNNVKDEIDRLIELDKIEKLVKAKIKSKNLGPRRSPLTQEQINHLEAVHLKKSGLMIKRMDKIDKDDLNEKLAERTLNITRGSVSGMGHKEAEVTRKLVLNQLRKFLDQDLDQLVREEGPIQVLTKTKKSAADFAIREHWESKERGPDWELDQWLHEHGIQTQPFKKFMEDWEEEKEPAGAIDSQHVMDSIDEFIKEMNNKE